MRTLFSERSPKQKVQAVRESESMLFCQTLFYSGISNVHSYV